MCPLLVQLALLGPTLPSRPNDIWIIQACSAGLLHSSWRLWESDCILPVDGNGLVFYAVRIITHIKLNQNMSMHWCEQTVDVWYICSGTHDCFIIVIVRMLISIENFWMTQLMTECGFVKRRRQNYSIKSEIMSPLCNSQRNIRGMITRLRHFHFQGFFIILVSLFCARFETVAEICNNVCTNKFHYINE